MYGGGREDVHEGRIDVRVVILVSYLAESYGEVTVSSLFSGHRKYARPGVVSAHIYGQAVDIATVGKLSIVGHQQPGSVTREGSSVDPDAAGHSPAPAGDLPAWPRRPLVPDGQPRRPHPRRVLKMSNRQATVRVNDRVACERCDVADHPVALMRGLLGRSDLPRGEGILLRPAGSIHTFFMRFPIDVVFLDADDRVLEISARTWRHGVRPA